MFIDIYSSNKHFGRNLIVAAGEKNYKLPMGVDSDFGSLKLISARLEIFDGVHNPVLNAAEVISQIKDKGYAFHSYRRLPRAREDRPSSPKIMTPSTAAQVGKTGLGTNRGVIAGKRRAD